MKTHHKIQTFLFVLALTSVLSANAQEFKTIFDTQKPLHISGFGGPLVEFSGVNKEFAVSAGGGGALIINNLFIGGYGLGLSTYHYKDIMVYEANNSVFRDYSHVPINFGHGGFWLGGSMKPNNALHLAGSIKIGWGAISFYNDYQYNNQYPNQYMEPAIMDHVFVLTPQLEAEINLARWFKINVGVGYRMVTGTDLTYVAYTQDLMYIGQQKYFDNSEFNSFTGTVSLLFGGFSK